MAGLDAAKLSGAVARLCEILELANRLYAISPTAHRAAALNALNALYAFIEEIDETRVHDLSTPISTLAAALTDLDRGVTPKMLEPKACGGGRPPDALGREITKGGAAAVMSALMIVGLRRKDAAMRIAKKLHSSGVTLDGRRELDWQTVANWRNQVKTAAEQSDSVAAITYRIFEIKMAAQKGWPPKASEVEPRVRASFCALAIDSLGWLLTHGGV